MLGIFIAALIVVVFLNFFLFIIIKKIVQIVTEQTKSYFVIKLQVFDDLIEEKQKQLDALNEKIEEASSVRINNEPSITSSNTNKNNNLDWKTPSYKDEQLLKSYKIITEKFDIDEKKVVQNFIQEKLGVNASKGNTEKYEMLNKLREKFGFNFIYDLSTLSKDTQTKFVLDNFKGKELFVIKKYLDQNQFFDCMEFTKYLDDCIKKEDPFIYIKTGLKNANYDKINKNIKTIYNPNINKGIQIIYKDEIYDCAL